MLIYQNAHHVTENSLTCWPVTLFLMVQIISSLVWRHVTWSYPLNQNLREINKNLMTLYENYQCNLLIIIEMTGKFHITYYYQ